MKAAYYDLQGLAKDVLHIGNLPDPEPGFGEVRVKVMVSGINPSDIKTRIGFAGASMKFDRIVPHQDGAGIIDKIGEGVSSERIGERVWVYKAQTKRPFGTAAQYVTLPSEHAVKLADNVSFEIGATLGIAAITAHRCLFADGDLRGLRVLVQGGGGAVGTASILLAKWAGAWVAATVSNPEQAKIAQEAGADLIINRHIQDIAQSIKEATKGAGIDRIVDVDLATNAEIDIACLAPSGVVSAYATENPKEQFSVPFLHTMFGGYVFRFVFFYSIPEEAFKQAVKEVSACVNSGYYKPHIGAVFPLDDVVEAHQAQENRNVLGKIILKVTDE
jgi:NADPH:quinone reductase